MQGLFSEREFYDWLERLSAGYGEAMTAWGMAAQVAAAGGPGDSTALLGATDSAIDFLVAGLMEIGDRHENPRLPRSGMLVLETLDRLLAASVEFLRDARTGLQERGLAVLSTLSPRVSSLRALEADVERATDEMRGKLDDSFGTPGQLWP